MRAALSERIEPPAAPRFPPAASGRGKPSGIIRTSQLTDPLPPVRNALHAFPLAKGRTATTLPPPQFRRPSTLRAVTAPPSRNMIEFLVEHSQLREDMLLLEGKRFY